MIIIKSIIKQVPDESGELKPLIEPERFPTKEEELNSGGWFREHKGFYYFVEKNDNLQMPNTVEGWAQMDSLLDSLPK